MSDRKLAPWLWGCGIGCGVALLIVVGVFAASFFFARNMVQGFKQAEDSQAALRERFGSPDEFTPWPDGAIPAERMEAFLGVRESSAEARDALAAKFDRIRRLATKDEAHDVKSRSLGDKFRFAFRVGSSAFGLGAELGRFYAARNTAMLDAGVGPGEYEYLYVLAYFSWLGHSPRDGMDNLEVKAPHTTRVEGLEGGVAQWDVEHGADGDGAGDEGLDPVARRKLLAMLENQLAALDEVPRDAAPDGWRERLEAEIRAMRADRSRVPWQDGLPDRTAASFEPYRERLEATYDPAANFFDQQFGEARSVQFHSR